MKIITNPQYSCVLSNCPDCLAEIKKSYWIEIVIGIAILLIGSAGVWLHFSPKTKKADERK